MAQSHRVMFPCCHPQASYVIMVIINDKTDVVCAGLWFSVEILTAYTYTKSQTTLLVKKNMNPKAVTTFQFEYLCWLPQISSIQSFSFVIWDLAIQFILHTTFPPPQRKDLPRRSSLWAKSDQNS